MKKLYTFAALAALSVSATLTASAGTLNAVDGTVTPAQKVFTKTTGALSLKAPLTASVSFKGTPTALKAPARAEEADTEWEALGEAQFSDGLLYAAYGMGTQPSYGVQAFRSKTDNNVYKFENIFPLEYLNDAEYALDDNSQCYSQTDNKESSVILTVGADNKVVATFDLNLTLTQLDAATTVVQTDKGVLNNGNFYFGEQSMIVCYGGSPFAYNTPFTIVLPGAKDYSFEMEALSDVCTPEKEYSFAILGSADAPDMKYMIVEDIYGATDGNVSYLAQNGSPIQSGSYTINYADYTPGWYTILVATLDTEGKGVFGNALYFYVQPEFVAEEWAPLGMVNYVDDVVPNTGSAPAPYKVALYENKANPAKFAVANMFSNHPNAESWSDHGHDHYLYIDAPDDDNVTIALQPIGVKYNFTEDLSLQSIRPGSIKDGQLTFQADDLVYYYSDLTGYYANRNGRFALEVPDLLTVTVTIDGTPVENAFVNYADWSGEGVFTDADGKAYMPVEPGYTGEFMAYKDGYELSTFAAAAKGRLLTAETTLEAAAASFFLTVLDADDEPLEGVLVSILGQEGTTAENGQVRINGLNGPDVIGKEIEYSAYKDGYAYYEGKADFSESLDAMDVINLETEMATLTVIVLGLDDEPVEGAFVTFLDQEATTGENGQVKFTGIPAPDVIGKTVPFTAYKDGYEFLEGEADFTETMEAYAIANLTEAEATLNVIVLDDNDDVVSGATVSFLGQEYTADENGKVTVTGIHGLAVIGKNIPVEITAAGYKPWTGEANFTEGLEAYVIATLTGSDGIDSVLGDLDNADTRVYDLQGRRTATPANGHIYIINGVKVRINR
ncbi:MAG: hypothetical protein K2M19_09320 [Muribaculaceae bacterium]|nr:hypothetical protein [Muribaculaceae bacterium]